MYIVDNRALLKKGLLLHEQISRAPSFSSGHNTFLTISYRICFKIQPYIKILQFSFLVSSRLTVSLSQKSYFDQEIPSYKLSS